MIFQKDGIIFYEAYWSKIGDRQDKYPMAVPQLWYLFTGGENMTAAEREQLYDEVWAEPMMITVCKRYGISDVALRKRCIAAGFDKVTPIPGV